MIFRSLGLKRPKVTPEIEDRIPPGQYLTEKWPVLHYGSIPSFNPASWDFKVFGLVDRPLKMDWEEFQQLPIAAIHADMHCVTRWSRLDNVWEGVSAATIIEMAGVQPETKFVTFHCENGYTTSVPFEVFNDEDVLLALKHDGDVLSAEHGYPLRSVVPKRYAWKSAKWLRGIEFMAEDKLGFWERYGYNNSADFWEEERFA